MYIGGVLLAAGMELVIAPQDQLNGVETIRLILHRVAGTRQGDNGPWVVLDGRESHARVAVTTWAPRRVYVRVSALKRCLALSG